MSTQDIAGQWYRVSDDTLDEDNQRPMVAKLISDRGLIPGKEYVAHDMSAFKGEHKILLQEALEDMRAGRINVLVFRDASRIDRDLSLQDIVKMVKAAGGRLISVKEAWIEDASSDRSMIGDIQSVVTGWSNYLYSKMISENVTEAHRIIRANGYWVGKIPFGYVTAGEKRKKILERDPVNSALASEVFQRAADGRTASSICAWLDTVAPQVIKKSGKASPWRAKRIIDMVHNPVYKGQHPTHTGYDALVTPKIWDAANAAMASRSFSVGTHDTGGRRTVHGYSGAVYCQCGAPFYHHHSTRNGKPVGTAKYRCARGRRGIGGETRCDAAGIPFEAANAVIDAYMLEDYRNEYVTVTTGGDAERQAQIQALEADMAAANKRKDRKTAISVLERIEALEGMPATPVITVPRKTGRKIADTWATGTLADRRAILESWKGIQWITVTLEDGKPVARLDELEDTTPTGHDGREIPNPQMLIEALRAA